MVTVALLSLPYALAQTASFVTASVALVGASICNWQFYSDCGSKDHHNGSYAKPLTSTSVANSDLFASILAGKIYVTLGSNSDVPNQ